MWLAATVDSEAAKEHLMANQQHQNPQRPGTDHQQPTPSPGQTGQRNQNSGEQSQKQNPADQDAQKPREDRRSDPV